MREMVFKMEREGLLAEGDMVTVSEGELPGSYYYVIEPAYAMSGNVEPSARLAARSGKVKSITRNERGFYVTAEFPDEE